METPTIKFIKDILPKIEESRNSFRLYYKNQGTDLEAALYGNETEYSVNGIVGGVNNVITDMRYLTKAHNQFIKLSTLDERNQIKTTLTNLNSYLSSHQVNQVTQTLDKLKTLLRSYNLRLDKERYLEFDNAIDELCRKAIVIGDEIEKVKAKLAESESTYQALDKKRNEFDLALSNLIEQKDTFSEEFDTFKKETSDFRDLAHSAQTNSKSIANNLSNTNDAKQEFDKFLEKIDERETQLENQSKETENYNKKLIEFSNSYEEKLKEVQNLIEKAKLALQFSTAEGMSAAFDTQYKNADKWYYKVGWLTGAFIFVIATLLIGAWIVTGYGVEYKQETMWFSLVGRLSMIPFTIYAAIFCAQQYVKQKNLIEDYAYKSVLSKSIVAFSEELRVNDTEKYTEYLSTVLHEIHQDPLRKRGKEKEDTYKESSGIIGKLIDLVQTMVKQNSD